MKPFGSKPRLPDRECFVRAAQSKPYIHRPSAATIELEDKEPRQNAWGMLGTGIFILGFCAVALFAFPDPADHQAALAGSAVFIPIGLGLAIFSVNLHVAFTRVGIAHDTVSWQRRNLFGVRSFEESLSSYLCITPLALTYSSDGELAGVIHYARLIHSVDPARDVVLPVRAQDGIQMILDRGGEREAFENLARNLDLPLATVRTDGNISFRHPDALDQSVYMQISDTPPKPADGSFPPKKYHLTVLPDGFDAVRTYRLYLLPFLGFSGSAALVHRFNHIINAGFGLPLVLFMFSLFMLAFSLTRFRLTLRSGILEQTTSIAWFRIQEKRMTLSEIEELGRIIDPLTRRGVLRIASDSATISWAEGDKTEVQGWFENAILRQFASIDKHS